MPFPLNTVPHKLQSHFRWLICFIVFLAILIIYMDRQIMGLLKDDYFVDAKPAVVSQQTPVTEQAVTPPPDHKPFHWTNAEFGWVTACFQGAYAIGLLGFGWLLDRFGLKIGYSLSLALWSIVMGCHALVTSLVGFYFVRGALGVSEGGAYPGATKTLAQWFPKSQRAFAASIVNSGANIGALLAPATVPFMAVAWGWQSPFLIVGATGLVWLVAWWALYSAPQNHSKVSPSELAFITQDGDQVPADPADQRKISWLGLLAYRQTWAYIVAKLLTDPVWYFFLTWLPDFFHSTRGLDIKKSWPHLVTIYSIITVLSLCGGWLTGYLISRKWSVPAARKTGLFCFALLVMPIVFATRVDIWTAVFLIGLAGAAHQAWSANLYTTVSDMFPNRAVASVVGIGSMAGSLGAIAFPIICGNLRDTYGSASYVWLFGYCGVAYLVAFSIHHFLVPKFEPVV